MSKKLIALALAVLFAASLPGPAGAQSPVEPVDLEVISLDYYFPAPDSIRIVATYNVYYYDSIPANYSTAIEFWLGAFVVHTQPLQISSSGSVCSGDPNCDIVCNLDVSGGQVQSTNCTQWYTWGGPTCDPGNPSGTCDPMVVCACGSQFTAEYNGSYNGEATIYVAGDPNHTMTEADETNNCMAVGPVPVVPSTWGAIKALFE